MYPINLDCLKSSNNKEENVKSEILRGQDREPLALYTNSKVAPSRIKLVSRITDIKDNHEDTLDKLMGRSPKLRPEHQEEDVN